MDDPHAEVEIKPQLKPRGSVAKEEDSKSCHQLYKLVGRFWVFLLNHTVPGFPLWFYFHLCVWLVHWGLAPEAALEGLGLPL